MKLHFHGGAKEVGRSCIELQTKKGNRYLLDVGVKFVHDGLAFPKNVLNIKKVNATFLSHAHLDHSGGLPLFEHKKLQSPIYTTSQTLAISKILLKDSYQIARIKNLHPEYDKNDLRQVSKDVKKVSFDKWYTKDDIQFKFVNAGHVPGSAMILIKTETKTLLYTADFNCAKTHLVQPASPKYFKDTNIDVMISESTYGDRDLPNRHEQEKLFIKKIKETLRRGGSALIPVFALGRAQDVLIMLAREDFKVPIFFDGMGKRITRKIMKTSSRYVKNKNTLANMYHNIVQLVGSKKRRIDSTKKQGIFVTTSGMVQGGPILTYLGEMWHNPNHSILMTGFQAKGTNGRRLLEKGEAYLDSGRTKIKCEIQKYDFSGHSGKKDIQEFFQAINPKHVIFQHGDPSGVNALKHWAEKETGANVYAPGVDQKYEF